MSTLSGLTQLFYSGARAFVIVGSAANRRRQSAKTAGSIPSARAAALSITWRTSHSSACRIGSISVSQT